jgi:hypothetical protein
MVAIGLKNPLCKQMFCYEFCKEKKKRLNGINYNKAVETGTCESNLDQSANKKSYS